MSTSSSNMFVHHISNVSPSKNSVVFLSMLLFHINSSPEVLIRDDPSSKHTLSSHQAKSRNTSPSIDCDVIRSSTDLATSTSVIHNIATVEQPEQERTSVLQLVCQHWKPDVSGNLSKCSSEIWFPRNFHHTILKISSSCMIQRVPGRKLPGKARCWY